MLTAITANNVLRLLRNSADRSTSSFSRLRVQVTFIDFTICGFRGGNDEWSNGHETITVIAGGFSYHRRNIKVGQLVNTQA